MESIIAKLDAMGFVNIRLLKPSKTRSKTENAVADPAMYIYPRKFTCPVCGADFQNFFLRPSRLRLDGTDLDLRPFYSPFDVTYYDVVLCPYCGYSAMSKYFYNIIAQKDDLIKEHVTPYFLYRDYPMIYTVEIAIERYLVALLNTLVKGANNSERAYICLKLSWLYRDKNDVDQEAMFRRYALAGFKTALFEEALPICGMDETTVLYLLGELSRRDGDFENAALYISRALGARNVSSRLREKMLTVKEMIKKDKGKEAALEPFKNIIKEIYNTNTKEPFRN